MKSHLKFIKFVLVGCLGFALNIGVTYIFKEFFGFWYFWSFLISVWFTWTFLFFGNLYFTFHDSSRENLLKKYLNFLKGYILIFILNAGMVYLLTSILSVHYLLSIFISTVLTTLATFSFSKKFVYLK